LVHGLEDGKSIAWAKVFAKANIKYFFCKKMYLSTLDSGMGMERQGGKKKRKQQDPRDKRKKIIPSRKESSPRNKNQKSLI
jgi:hypothetical protein